MRRVATVVDPRKERTKTVRPIWPWFFWKKCHKCGIEFRKEWGWAVRYSRTIHYVCGQCASTPYEAEMTDSPRPQMHLVGGSPP